MKRKGKTQKPWTFAEELESQRIWRKVLESGQAVSITPARGLELAIKYGRLDLIAQNGRRLAPRKPSR